MNVCDDLFDSILNSTCQKNLKVIDNERERSSTFVCHLSFHSQFVQEMSGNAKFASISCLSVDNAETQTQAGGLA